MFMHGAQCEAYSLTNITTNSKDLKFLKHFTFLNGCLGPWLMFMHGAQCEAYSLTYITTNIKDLKILYDLTFLNGN